MTVKVRLSHCWRMKLQTYMDLKKITDAEMAALVGVHRTRINRYRRGLETPSMVTARKIALVTDGAVSLNEWQAEAA